MDIQEKMIFKSREDEAKDRSKKVAQELHQAARDKKIKDMLHSIHHAHEKTMSEDTEHLGNVVGLVANHDFTGATEIVHGLLNQRVVGALDEYKRTVAQNLFSPVPRELEEETEQLDEMNWHQKRSGTKLYHPTKWSLVTHAPDSDSASSFLHDSEESAKEHMKVLRTNNPEYYKHSYILKPASSK